MQLLSPKAISGYGSMLDYETHILIGSLLKATRGGKLPIDPAHYVGRFALKSAVFSLHSCEFYTKHLNSNMLIIAYGTRTDSTSAPLVKKALDLAIEFMDLTGEYSRDRFFCKRTDPPSKVLGRTLLTFSRCSNGYPLRKKLGGANFTTTSSMLMET